MRKPTLHVIDGSPPPDTPTERVMARVRNHPKPKTMLSCPRCGGREVIVAKIGMLYSESKISGGTKSVLCVQCLMKGQRVLVV